MVKFIKLVFRNIDFKLTLSRFLGEIKLRFTHFFDVPRTARLRSRRRRCVIVAASRGRRRRSKAGGGLGHKEIFGRRQAVVASRTWRPPGGGRRGEEGRFDRQPLTAIRRPTTGGYYDTPPTAASFIRFTHFFDCSTADADTKIPRKQPLPRDLISVNVFELLLYDLIGIGSVTGLKPCVARGQRIVRLGLLRISMSVIQATI